MGKSTSKQTEPKPDQLDGSSKPKPAPSISTPAIAQTTSDTKAADTKQAQTTSVTKADTKQAQITSVTKATDTKKAVDAKAVPQDRTPSKTTFSPKAFQAIPINTSDVPKFKNLSRKDCETLLKSEKKITSMMDRTGSVKVSVYILSTLQNGLPLFNAKPKVNEEIKFCLNYIFYRASVEKDATEKKNLLLKVARAYQSCQTVQQQIITQIYAGLCNVELTLESQVMQMLSSYKTRVLEEVVMMKNPDANLVSDDYPNKQPPHIRSAYILALQENKIMLEGIEGSNLDVNKPNLTAPVKKSVVELYRTMLHPDDFVKDFILDVNAKGGLARFIDRDKFYKWVMSLPEDSDFDKHSIFYDEDLEDAYDAPQDEDDRLSLPYLRFDVACNVLKHLQILE